MMVLDPTQWATHSLWESEALWYTGHCLHEPSLSWIELLAHFGVAHSVFEIGIIYGKQEAHWP